MNHVVIHPHSNTNDSDWYLVVSIPLWATMMDNGSKFVADMERHFTSYVEAREAAEDANAQ